MLLLFTSQFLQLFLFQCRVLNQEQIEEWLGWMQLVILIYWVTGGSAVSDSSQLQLSLYNHVQLLISAHLFILGYQHFHFMWKNHGPAKEFVKLCQVGPKIFSLFISNKAARLIIVKVFNLDCIGN